MKYLEMFIKKFLFCLAGLFGIIVIIGSIVTFWPCDPYVCGSPSIRDIWEAGVWWTFGIIIMCLQSFAGIVLLCLMVVFIYCCIMRDALKKYKK